MKYFRFKVKMNYKLKLFNALKFKFESDRKVNQMLQSSRFQMKNMIFFTLYNRKQQKKLDLHLKTIIMKKRHKTIKNKIFTSWLKTYRYYARATNPNNTYS